MAGDWLQIQRGVVHGTAILRIAAKLKISHAEALGRWLIIWEWATRHLSAADLKRSDSDHILSAQVLDDVAGLPGFAAALHETGLWDASNGFADLCRPWKKIHRRVYIIRASGTDLYKIGFSSSPLGKRLNQLTSGCPYPLQVVLDLPCSNAKELEKKSHKRFADRKQKGEWFVFIAAQIEVAISFCRTHATE